MKRTSKTQMMPHKSKKGMPNLDAFRALAANSLSAVKNENHLPIKVARNHARPGFWTKPTWRATILGRIHPRLALPSLLTGPRVPKSPLGRPRRRPSLQQSIRSPRRPRSHLHYVRRVQSLLVALEVLRVLMDVLSSRVVSPTSSGLPLKDPPNPSWQKDCLCFSTNLKATKRLKR